ncbi:hypothetical protein F5883DRAFT_166007 [Diaporthe sp. PMI_573]|nr:hypothetical protein F5883DRAFT_166007 [Diaporthaceae sp. PMI_573]
MPVQSGAAFMLRNNPFKKENANRCRGSDNAIRRGQSMRPWRQVLGGKLFWDDLLCSGRHGGMQGLWSRLHMEVDSPELAVDITVLVHLCGVGGGRLVVRGAVGLGPVRRVLARAGRTGVVLVEAPLAAAARGVMHGPGGHQVAFTVCQALGEPVTQQPSSAGHRGLVRHARVEALEVVDGELEHLPPVGGGPGLVCGAHWLVDDVYWPLDTPALADAGRAVLRPVSHVAARPPLQGDSRSPPQRQ